jgi:hypothetical protein
LGGTTATRATVWAPPTARTPSPAADDAPAGRNAALDLLRLAAALVIVLFHAKSPGAGWMPAAMGLFTALMACLARTGRVGGSVGAAARRRPGRLLRPFAIWAAIYFGLRLADAVAAHQPLGATAAGWFPPQGTMGALWFLPFAFAASLALLALHRRVPGIAAPGVALPLAAAGSALWLLILDRTDPAPGIAVFLAYEPALFFGVALASAAASPGWLGLTGAASLAVGLLLRAADVDGTDQLVLSVPLLAAALAFGPPGTRATRAAADLSMAVYLVHVAVLALMLRTLPFPLGSVELGAAGFVVSVLLGRALLRSRLGRLLF